MNLSIKVEQIWSKIDVGDDSMMVLKKKKQNV